ncbi:SH3 domain-binding protein 5 homolog isoform X2 [Pseudomyrmex gracilis]|uniref:SH3 domain-binding protein 5 homolog isoform X2 n=1 Tax=Pseudomyrmex gracilis TaxID=219809 RepID=UPI000994EA82|nr:SH3 domain-binding protein 5 homolog isoform X2 [Pseudomyrmex gracilis]
MDVAEDAEGALDPRVQIELENLNNATDNINKLEIELDEAHTAFGQLLTDTPRRLKEITDKLGTACIEKARCYYEALEVARQTQVQCQQQAQLFQRASEIHAAAKETVALAEARFMSHQHEWNFDQAWQDMLNHATIKVMDAENQKAECGREHHRRAMLFHDAEKRLLQLEEKHRRAIIKARPYFEVKAQCDQMLETQKERVEYLQQTIKETKRNYAMSLRTLEEISNQIHQQRRDYDIVANGPREPGVGAELIGSDIYQKYKNHLRSPDSLKMCSNRCAESRIDEKLRDIEVGKNLQKPGSAKEDAEHLEKRSVDGSESKCTQWELELQASMEKLNCSSIENSLYVKEQDEVPSSSSDPRDPDVGTRYNLLPAELSEPHSSNRSSSSTKEPETFFGRPLQRSCSTQNSTLRGTTITTKSDISKSLNNSPINRNLFNLKSGNVTKKTGSADASKYVPNGISQFYIQNGNAQNEKDDDKRRPASSQDDGTVSLRSNSAIVSRQSASCSVGSSPAKLMPTADGGERETGPGNRANVNSIKELPLLSLFGSTSALSTLIKGKSCSMIDLDGKPSLRTLLDKSRLGNIRAVSMERLANVRHNVINNYVETKTNDVTSNE